MKVTNRLIEQWLNHVTRIQTPSPVIEVVAKEAKENNPPSSFDFASFDAVQKCLKRSELCFGRFYRCVGIVDPVWWDLDVPVGPRGPEMNFLYETRRVFPSCQHSPLQLTTRCRLQRRSSAFIPEVVTLLNLLNPRVESPAGPRWPWQVRHTILSDLIHSDGTRRGPEVTVVPLGARRKYCAYVPYVLLLLLALVVYSVYYYYCIT